MGLFNFINEQEKTIYKEEQRVKIMDRKVNNFEKWLLKMVDQYERLESEDDPVSLARSGVFKTVLEEWNKK